jgi:ubiquinone/menaquinone biosynthesis C-methylase UbiE
VPGNYASGVFIGHRLKSMLLLVYAASMRVPPKRTQRVGARQGYDLWSETYDSTPNPVVAMDARHTLPLLAPKQGELILDAGCGTGRNLKRLLLTGSIPIGIDFSDGMLRVARRGHPDAPLAIADLQQPLPFKDASFDAVLCALIGEHLSELLDVLREFFRILKKNGRLVFSVYHPVMSAAGIEANFEQAGVEYRLGAVHYSVEQHLRLVEDAGFAEIRVNEFRGDEELVRSAPAAVKYLNSPILLVLTAMKP